MFVDYRQYKVKSSKANKVQKQISLWNCKFIIARVSLVIFRILCWEFLSHKSFLESVLNRDCPPMVVLDPILLKQVTY